MTLSELTQAVENAGWMRVRTRGPHRQYVHPEKAGLLTIRRHLTDELSPAAVHSVLTGAGMVP